MASRYEAQVTITSAKDLKNVNWRHGRLKPYVVAWIDPNSKTSTRIDDEGDTNPYWDQTLVVPFNSPIEDSVLYIDVVHANPGGEDIKPLVGSARLPLRDVVDDVGLGQSAGRKLELKRPSHRPHGKIDVQIVVREPRYRAPDPYSAQPYGVQQTSREYSDRPSYGNTYPAPYQQPSGYPYGESPYGQPQPGYGQPQPAYGQPQPGYGQPQPTYGQPQPGYGQAAYGQESYGQPAPSGYGYGQDSYGQPKEEKKSKYGMGTGVAVGAVGGLLGGLALAEGFDYLGDKITDDVTEKVEDNLEDEDRGDRDDDRGDRDDDRGDDRDDGDDGDYGDD
ncbi:hypothetical protein U1Q18_031723 [Sarracenia purpurea var. burkii]